ncbi:methylated-DNA-[protein]-cysteine S-methyltransferase [Murinocardiopsis flavida]|uniref:Methylated-DNA-[protein]-cysteine S-methyltransferase n=1 Tax=Murinocardiopsis flavida TaxID=645275 RepID=A0A2P8DQ47_9ACTN|nr:methylated-DNA--[protein]-cysteine S-methyltransferase [Murinocardiopsis flavida]PSK99340.1 methylated-DNA-[protein]-cysteine S-methyltransferase [Murinocardiopsis flavida]
MTVNPVRRPAGADIARAAAETPVGRLFLAATDRGLAACTFEPESAVIPRLDRAGSPGGPADIEALDLARRELDGYFAGRLTVFTVPCDLRSASDFSRMALVELRRVPFGSTLTADELAQRIGRGRAVRAIGNTLATNPLCVVLPCHRVVPRGYPAEVGTHPGGAAVKRHLLALEGAAA